MIDPSRLQEDDLIILGVVRHGHGTVLTAQVKRGTRNLLRSPEIVTPKKPLERFPDMHLVCALIDALPPLNRLPRGLTLRAERALCGDKPVKPVPEANPSDPLVRLNCTIHVDAMENMAADMWRGFTRIEVRVVRGDSKRRPLEPVPAGAPRSGTPLVGSAAAKLEPVG